MSLHQFNAGIKSWKMYAKELTSKSGDDLTIHPYDDNNLILEASGNGSILFKQDGITYTMADLSNGGTSELVSGTGITISNDVISIGQEVGITSNVTFNNITSNDTINDVYIKSNTAYFTNSMSITNHNFTSINGAINNTFFGYNSGIPLSTGDANVGIGNASLNKITSGNNNCAIGYESLYDNTTGNDNTAIGSYSLYLNTNGQYNTAIGSQSLYSNTSGNYNVALGLAAGSVNTSGSNNIYIGYNTLASATNNNNEIVIGNSVTGSGTNTVTIGANDNIAHYLGKALIGNVGHSSSYAGFSYRGLDSSSYALLQDNYGGTRINAKTGQIIYFFINNDSNNGFTFNGSTLDMNNKIISNVGNLYHDTLNTNSLKTRTKEYSFSLPYTNTWATFATISRNFVTNVWRSCMVEFCVAYSTSDGGGSGGGTYVGNFRYNFISNGTRSIYTFAISQVYNNGGYIGFQFNALTPTNGAGGVEVQIRNYRSPNTQDVVVSMKITSLDYFDLT